MTTLSSDPTSAGTPGDSRRWLILGVVGIAQLMVVLDLTIMNIALPSAQRDLGFSTVDRQWVVTAYTLSFGSLLLLGGRLSDLLGRKTTIAKLLQYKRSALEVYCENRRGDARSGDAVRGSSTA